MITKDIADGGLKFPDVIKFAMCNTLQWLRRLSEDGSQAAKNMLRDFEIIGGIRNITAKRTPKFKKDHPMLAFNEHLVEEWNRFQKTIHTGIHPGVSLRYNAELDDSARGGRIIANMIPRLMRKGFNTFGDLLDEGGTFIDQLDNTFIFFKNSNGRG